MTHSAPDPISSVGQSADAAVREWYSHHTIGTDLGLKYFDWRMTHTEPMIHGKDVLNCGFGYPIDEVVLGQFARRWVAIDFTPAVVARGSAQIKLDNVEFCVADFRALPYVDGEFDTVLDFSSGDHVYEGRNLVRTEAFRVLRPGGYYVVTYANREHYDDGIVDKFGDWGYERRASVREMFDELERAGFVILHHDEPSARSGIVARKP